MISKMLVVSIICLLGFTQDVPVIDLTTAPVHPLTREPHKGSLIGGVAGGNPSWPLAIQLISAREEPDAESQVLIYEIELRNTGKTPIDLPVDPSARDVEPSDPAVKRYEFVSASIALELHPDSAGMQLDALKLYGSELASGTKRRLDPGSALRFRAKSKITGVSQDQTQDGRNMPRTISAFFFMHQNVVTSDSIETRQIMGPVNSSNAVPITVR